MDTRKDLPRNFSKVVINRYIKKQTRLQTGWQIKQYWGRFIVEIFIVFSKYKTLPEL